MKSFNVPSFYRSPLISKIKLHLKSQDPHRKSKRPFLINTERFSLLIARHFGFCYGVENAIDIAFKALNEHSGKSIYLISEMIHNPQVNQDLIKRGVRFLHDTLGKSLIPIDTLQPDDVVIIPAFGASVPVLNQLKASGVKLHTYDATCPFVERVWNRAEKLGSSQFTILVHGTHDHEETRATFSRAVLQNTPVLILRTLEEAHCIAQWIKNPPSFFEFEQRFKGRYSPGFNPQTDFTRMGVINQTTMLASETQTIAEIIKQALQSHYGVSNLSNHFADTRDTLCYATNENQESVIQLRDEKPDMVFVVGGYNSSNTSHLAELCESVCPTFFIEAANCIQTDTIAHFNFHEKVIIQTAWPKLLNPRIGITSGASCPDAVIESVMYRIAEHFNYTESQFSNFFSHL